MSQQPMNLRRSNQVARRHKALLGALVVVGLAAGAAYGVISPAKLTSQAFVVVPVSNSAPPMAEEVVIAESIPVLTLALPKVSPAGMSATALRKQVQVSETANILQISAAGTTAAQAEGNANAVAKAFIAYDNSPVNPAGPVLAKPLGSASPATGTSPLVHNLTFAGIGALIGLLVGYVLALAVGRRNRKLRLRDDIANSVGIPVLASVPTARPSNPADWAKLLSTYEPGAIHAWRLRKTLQQLALAGVRLTGDRDDDSKGSSSVSVISLANDPGALALGPQLAVFASSLGIPTVLVVGPQQDPNVTAALRTACAQLKSPPGRALLWTSATDDRDGDGHPDTVLSVRVGVVDPQQPRVADTMRGTATVIGVTAGVVTADQLARVAVSAASDDRDIAGILVANPDPADQTTGRVPQLAGTPRQVMPTRLTGKVTEAKR
jgi:capsular polysaccharide biosynthesis protein